MSKKNQIKKSIISMLCMTLMLGGITATTLASSASSQAVTILFTHDLHDHFLPQNESVEGKTQSLGGYGRLQTLIKEARRENPELLLVDAGDFSMGTLFQTIYDTQAPQLRIMGEIGYDAVTFGNHEFDFRADGLAKSLKAAKESGDPIPPLVASNITFENPKSTEDLEPLRQAMNEYGVVPYSVIEKAGVKIGVFGLMGKVADSNAPKAGVKFLDQIESAKTTVKYLKEQEQVDLVLCLSHSGTNSDKKHSEDELLASSVPDIDVIISGHTHTTLEQPLVVGDTIIGSCGAYGDALGKVEVRQNKKGKWELDGYSLIPITKDVAEDRAIKQMITGYQDMIEKQYLSQFEYTFNQILGYTDFDFESVAMIGKNHEELRLGSFVSDAFRYGVKKAEGDTYEPIAMTAVPSGTIRGTFPKGEISVSDVFTVSSLGLGADGTPGYPLVSAYLTGKELKTVCEVDASIAPIMADAQLYLSGLYYTFNPHRMIFNKVTESYLINEEGKRQIIDDEKLYRVVVGLYTAQMLSVVGEKSFGILSIIPKDEQGIPITDLESRIVYDPTSGRELKEWVAIADYIQSSDKVNGISQVSSRYNQTENRKVVNEDTGFVAKVKAPNQFAIIVYSLLLFFIGVIILLGAKIVRKTKKVRKSR